MANSEEKLRKLLQKIAKEQDYTECSIEIKPITSGGANYTTVLYLASISEAADKNDEKPDLKDFAKVATLNEEVRKHNEMMAQVYVIETLFYTELAVNAEKIYGKNNVLMENRLRLPKYYGHDLTILDEIMVLQNLEATGFTNTSIHQNYCIDKETLPQGLTISLLMTAMVTVDPEDAPKIEADFKSLEIKPNQLAKQRLNGIARDFIRWGVL